MDEPQVASIAEHVTASWSNPNNIVTTELATQWLKDFKLLDFETMVFAVDRLRQTQDFPPTTHQMIEMHGKLWVELHPRLPAHDATAEQDPKRPYNRAWRLLTETWQVLRRAAYSTSSSKEANARARRLFLQVNTEIQALHAATKDLMPEGPDVVAPASLVALAVAAQERVRVLLFGEAATAAQDAVDGTVGHLPATSSPLPSSPPEIRVGVDRYGDRVPLEPDDVY
jgi:hypothetical protein